MTTTTKILLVLVCLFALIFTPLAIQFVAMTNDWKAAALGHADTIDDANATQRNAWTMMQATVAQKQRQAIKSNATIEDLRDKIAQMEIDNSDQNAKYAALEQQRDAAEAANHRMNAQIDVLLTLNTELFEEREGLIESEQKQRTRANELADRVQELNTELVLLKEKKYSLEETVRYLSSENDKLRQNLQLGPVGEIMTSTPSGQVSSETPAAWPSVRGEVTEVRGKSATINVGSNSGIQPDMKLVAFRGNELICDLVVTDNITPSEAVATITLAGDRNLKAGDSVIDEASLNKR